MTVPRRALVIAAVFTGSACNDAPPVDTGAPVVADSAGVRLVTNAASLPADTLRPDLLWEYGHDPSGYLFQFVTLGTVAADGSVVVADAGNREVIRVHSEGKAHTRLARPGEGPDEVSAPRQVIAGDDRVWVEDARLGKLIAFHGDTLATVISASENPLGPAGLMPIGVDSDGRLMLTTGRFRSDFEEPWLEAALATFDTESGVVDTVGTFPLAKRSEGPPRSPFGPHGVVATTGSSFVTGRTDVAAITWRGSDGSVSQIARWQPNVRYPTRDDWEEFRSGMASDLARVNPQRGGEGLDQLVDRVLSEYELDSDEAVRLFDNVYGTETGAVWVSPFMPSRGMPSSYAVMSSDGSWLAWVEFSRPFQFLHADSDIILGVHKDEFDVQTIAAYSNPFGM